MTNFISVARDLIKRHEELRLEVYDDANGNKIKPGVTVVGHPTIGYGRALDVDGISVVEADLLLSHGINTALDNCTKIYGLAFNSFSINRRAALIDMCYNLGENGLREFVNMNAAIMKGDWIEAARQALLSKWARQVGERASNDADLLRMG